MDLRKAEEKFFQGLMILAFMIIFVSLLLILVDIVVKGLPAMNLAMVTQAPKGGYYLGKEGGVLNAIVGSLTLAGGATVIALLLALPVALYLNVYLKKGSSVATFIRFSLDVLWGVPSIVYGAFGFTIMLFFGLRASLLGGIIAVALLIFPIMIRAMDESLKMIPQELLETSYSLGSTRLEISLKVIVRQGLSGILTAILIAFGRGIGDAASVLFTAGFSDYISFNLLRPVATLPLAIFFQLGTPFPEVRSRAYASSLILTVIIIVISVATRLLTKKFRHYVIK